MTLSCRAGCGACCIAPSISSPMPGASGGKPAGMRCMHLSDDFLCLLFDRPERPRVCASLQAEPQMCGETRDQALATLTRWERETAPPTAPENRNRCRERARPAA